MEFVGLFAGADEEGGDAEFLLDGDGDAAFAGAVELGDDEAVELDCFVEFFGLGEGVGAGAGVDDEDGFVGCGVVLFGKGAANFAEFFHEVVASVKAAGGVADEVFGVFGDGGFVGFVADGGGVGLVLADSDGEVEALGPRLQLFDGGGAKGVGGGDANGVTVDAEKVTELGGGGGFAGAVDANYENDGGFAGFLEGGGEGLVFGEDFGDVRAGGVDDVVGGDLAAEGAELVDDGQGEARAEVGGYQIGFEFVPVDLGLVGDFVEEVGEEACHVGRESRIQSPESRLGFSNVVRGRTGRIEGPVGNWVGLSGRPGFFWEKENCWAIIIGYSGCNRGS